MAWPVVREEPRRCGGAEAGPLIPSQLQRHAPGEMVGKNGYIADAMPPRRQGDDLERKSVAQIGAETPLADRPGQMVDGGGGDAGAHPDGPMGTDTGHLPQNEQTNSREQGG